MKEGKKEGRVRCSERFQTVSNGGLRGLSVAGGVKGCYATGEQQRLLSSQNFSVYRAERSPPNRRRGSFWLGEQVTRAPSAVLRREK